MVGRINQAAALAAILVLGGAIGASSAIARVAVSGPVAQVQMQDDGSDYGGSSGYDDSTQAPDDDDYRNAPDYYRERPYSRDRRDYRDPPDDRDRRDYQSRQEYRYQDYRAAPRYRETPSYRQRRDDRERQYAGDTAGAASGPTIAVARFRSDGLHTSAVIADNMRAFLVDALRRDGRFHVAEGDNGDFLIDGTVTRYNAGQQATDDTRLRQATLEISLRILTASGRRIGSVQAQSYGSAPNSGMDAVNTSGPPAPLEAYRNTALGRASAEAARLAVERIAAITGRS